MTTSDGHDGGGGTPNGGDGGGGGDPVRILVPAHDAPLIAAFLTLSLGDHNLIADLIWRFAEAASGG